MRSTEVTFDKKMDELVINGIKDMWNRLSCEASLKGTSLGTIADKAGISASAVYASIRKINRPDGGYTDTAVSQILVLAEGLGMDLDAAVTGTPAPRRTSVPEELSSILPSLTRKAKEGLRLEIISKLNV